MESEYRRKLHEIRMLKEINNHKQIVWDYYVGKSYPQFNLNFCLRILKKVLNKTCSSILLGEFKNQN